MYPSVIKILSIVFLVINLPYFYFSYLILINQSQPENIDAVVVLGASVYNDQTPTKVLQKRLDKTIEIFYEEKLENIVVSGDGGGMDNPETYNETLTMQNYLINKGIPEHKIIQDPTGYRTINSCKNLNEVHKLKKVYLVTQGFHIPRSLYLCQNYGLEIVPIYAETSTTSVSVYGHFREIFADWYAIVETKII